MVWARVQGNKTAATASAVSSVACAYVTANVSSGNKLIAVTSTSTQTGTTTTVATVKDGAGNSLTLVKRISAGGSPILCDVALWALDVPAGDVGTKPTLTATLSGGTANMGIVIQEVSGLAAGNTLAAMIDGTGGVLSGSALGATGSPSYASSVANEYLVAIEGDDGGPITWTAPSGLTVDANAVNSNGFSNTAIAYGNSTGGTEAGSWSLAGSTAEWGVILVAFKLASTSVTGTFSLALAPEAISFSQAATVTGTFSLALAPKALSFSPASQLVVSLASQAGTDPHTGAPFPVGLAIGAHGGPQIIVTLVNGIQGVIRFPSGAAFEQAIAQLESQEAGTSPAQFIQSVLASASTTTAGAHDLVALALNSAAADGSSSANLEFIYTASGGGASEFGYFDRTGFHILAGSITGAHPGTVPAVPESWQSLGTGPGGTWTINQARYRLTADGETEIDIALNAQTGGGSAGTFAMSNTLPAAYQFAGNYSRSFPLGYNGTVTSGAASGCILVDGAGTATPGRVRLQLPAMPATTNMCGTVRMPLA